MVALRVGGPGNEREYVRLLQEAASQGHADAQFNLALCFKQGVVVAQDFEHAVTFYRVATAQGHADAQYNLALCFKKGEGVAQDWDQAVAFYRLAAAHGHVNAQFNLALCFKDGVGVAQDLEEAMAFYRLAAAKGHAPAQNNLAVCLLETGAERNLKEALRLLRLASSNGLEVATAQLALIYQQGRAGEGRDLVKARSLRRQARKQAHARASGGDNASYADLLDRFGTVRCHNEACEKAETLMSARRREVGAWLPASCSDAKRCLALSLCRVFR
jgi:TPR repeat protein